jgi:hypothetical protein
MPKIWTSMGWECNRQGLVAISYELWAMGCFHPVFVWSFLAFALKTAQESHAGTEPSADHSSNCH